MAQVTFHLCWIFFNLRYKRPAGTDLFLFYSVFNENSANLAVSQQRGSSVLTVRDDLILFHRVNGGFRDRGDQEDSKVLGSKEKGWVRKLHNSSCQSLLLKCKLYAGTGEK